MAADSEAWQDFGQKVDLTARIREILLNYPEGTSILKELVQNADDARASCIKFCLDRRQHGTGSLLSPAMSAFQGPALLAYNDGVFSDRDLESISRIGDSKKKEEEGKTGRFGVGFNSCYHLTDVPSFVSGRHLVIFDPHCRHLPNISATNPGKRIDFVTYSDVAAQYRDQVAPYSGAFGCSLGAPQQQGEQGPWQGTLFRFPLRSAALAEASTISKQVYTPDSIRGLLQQLCVEAFQILLFLKHIQRLECGSGGRARPVRARQRHGEDMAGSGARRAQWNSLLLERVVAPAYAAALQQAAEQLGPGPAYDRLWPAADVAAPWQTLLVALYRRVSGLPVCWTQLRGGLWQAQQTTPATADPAGQLGAQDRGFQAWLAQAAFVPNNRGELHKPASGRSWPASAGATLFLAAGEGGRSSSSALAAGLGWGAPLAGSVLAQQLLQLGEMHARVSDAGLSQELAGVVPLLYRSLGALAPAEAAVARGLLAGSRCVWVGNGFAPAGRVAFKGSLDLSPWLYVLPAELAPFKALLLGYGAAEAFSAAQYAAFLQALADLALPPHAAVFLPDERGVLAPAPALAFNDAPWLAGQPASAAVRLLLQNADDAGASSLTLLLDECSYPTRSILSPAMAVWQGPALLVANDAVFSPADFTNISRIGQGVSAAQPGLKIAFARAQLLQQFPDAFTPFTQLGCSLSEKYMGTLFRFPLRTAAAAAVSDIKSTPCTPGEVRALLEAFRRQLPAAMLFLKNIRKVTAYVRLLFEATREVVDTAGGGGGGGGSSMLQSAITSFIAGIPSDPTDLATFYKRLAAAPASSLPSELGLMRLSLHTHASPLPLPQRALPAPAGKPAAGSGADDDSGHGSSIKLQDKAVAERWLVCNALGGGSARELAVKSYGGDMSGAGAARSSWNVSLLTDALAPAYARLLAAVAAQAGGPSPQLYRLLPPLDASEPWSHLVSALYRYQLAELPIVWTRAGGGRWISPRTALFSDAACAIEPLLRPLLVALGMPLACDVPAAAEAALLRGSRLLGGLGGRCLAAGLPPQLVSQLQQTIDLGLFNVQRLTPGLLDSTLLPLLLPPAWQGAAEVEWAPPAPAAATAATAAGGTDPVAAALQATGAGAAAAAGVSDGGAEVPATLAAAPQQQQQPSQEWVRLLWRWLAERPDVLELATWPVLPIQGGRLGMLQSKSLVLREGGWTEAVTSALLRLGCRLLDTALLPAAASAASPALQHVGPQAKALPCEALAAHVAGLLLRLPAAGAGAAAAGAGGALELQQLRQALSEQALIPTASADGELRRPSELMDPRSPSLESAVARLYAALGEAVDGPEGDLVAMSFERPDTPCVWVGMTITPAPAAPTAPASPAPGSEGTAGAVAALVEVSGGFVSPAAAALRADGGGDFRPYLWLVPEPLQRHGRLLGLMGVRDRLDLAARGGGVLLAHAALPQATAEALGVRSLRHAHEAEAQLTSALPCPSPAELRERLGLAAQGEPLPTSSSSDASASAAAAATFLLELMELADGLGLRCLRLVLDGRSHPAQSLLAPGLAQFQGPALCAVLPDVVLGPDDLAALLAGRASPPALRGGRAAAYASAGLASAFLVTELLQGVQLPIAAAATAAAAGMGARPEAVAAVAVCIGRDDTRDLFPVSGLFAPVYLPAPPMAAGRSGSGTGFAAGGGGGGLALGRMPFLVCGHFYMSRRGGKHVLSPFTRSISAAADVASGHAAAAAAHPNSASHGHHHGTGGGGLQPGASGPTATMALPPLLQHRCDHNRRVLDLASAAWQTLAVYFCSPEQYAGPRAHLYDTVFPDMAAITGAGGGATAATAATGATAGGAPGAVAGSSRDAAGPDEAALYCVRQIYAAAARLPLWRLRTGRFVHLPEGCFLQPLPAPTSTSSGGAAATASSAATAASVPNPLAGLGPAAMGFMARQLPLFDVPWAIKQHLEAADVHGLRAVSPAVVRPLLRNLGRRGGSGSGSGSLTSGGSGGGAGLGVAGGGGGGFGGSGGKLVWPGLTVLEATELLVFCSGDLVRNVVGDLCAAEFVHPDCVAKMTEHFKPGLLLPVRHARLAICLPPPRSLPVAGKEGAQAHAAPGDAAASSDGGGADTGAAAASAAAGPIPSLQDLAPSLPAPWDWLAPALHCLGVPLVDPRFNAVAARHCGPQPAELGLPPRALDEAAAATPSTLDPADILFLRRLPIYPTHAGTHTALDEPSAQQQQQQPPTVESGPAVCSPELLQLVPGLAAALPASVPARLLLPQPGAARLYGLLGVASLAAGAFLGGVVLRPGSGVFEALPDGVRALLLTHVQTHWSRLRGEEALTTALRDTAFVTAADGAAKKPSELYDPEQPLFAAAFLGCAVFPTDQFAFPAWLALLREARREIVGVVRKGRCCNAWRSGLTVCASPLRRTACRYSDAAAASDWPLVWLVPAHTAVSVGASSAGGSAGRLLGRLDPRCLTLAHPGLPEPVSAWLGCPRLSDVAEERLDPQHGLQPVEEMQGMTLRDARALLASPAFVAACHSMLRAHAPVLRTGFATAAAPADTGTTRSGPATAGSGSAATAAGGGGASTAPGSMHEVAALLRSAAGRLLFVRSLRTVAVLKATGAQLSPQAEASRVTYEFIEAPSTTAAASSYGGGSSSSLGRILVAEPPPYLQLSWLLSSVVSRVLGCPHPVVLPLEPLFTTPAAQLSALQPVLLPGGWDERLESAAVAGTPGTPLVPADAALLQLKPLRRYCAGEVVAYQRQVFCFSASELVAAVRDVLGAAGLPLDPAAGALMGRVAELQSELAGAKARLGETQREAESAAAEAENARSAWQCKICFSRDVDAAYTGCGHVICARCAAATATNRCPVCRKPSPALLKLYRA
eukprot:XP_001690195.1 predicted protein [Chlamydomonas reinhardtii]